KAFLVLEALDVAGELKVSDVVKLLGQKNVFPLLKSMLEKELVLISEELAPKFKPWKLRFLELAEEFKDEDGKRLLLDSLNRAAKQQDAVVAFIQLRKQNPKISRKILVEQTGVSDAAIRALIDK